jgi:hypothetical protein
MTPLMEIPPSSLPSLNAAWTCSLWVVCCRRAMPAARRQNNPPSAPESVKAFPPTSRRWSTTDQARNHRTYRIASDETSSHRCLKGKHMDRSDRGKPHAR